ASASSRSVGDRGDVDLELDLVRDQEAAGLERGVPGQAPLLAVQGGAALEAEAGVAERGLGGAGQLEVDRDRLGDVLDGQVAGDGPVVAVAGDLGGDEGDLGVGLDVEEVGAVQVAVAVRDTGVDAAGLDVHGHLAGGRVLGVDDGVAAELLERAAHGGHHRVPGAEAEAAVRRVERVLAGDVLQNGG